MAKDRYVYLFKSDIGAWKIGSSNWPGNRLQQFQGLPFVVKFAHCIVSTSAQWLEKVLHQTFYECRIRGEWFRLSDSDVAHIKAMERCDGYDDLPIFFHKGLFIPPEPRPRVDLDDARLISRIAERLGLSVRDYLDRALPDVMRPHLDYMTETVTRLMEEDEEEEEEENEQNQDAKTNEEVAP
jgi:hypothetical protein